MPSIIRVVTEIDAPPQVVFELALDMDVHAASLAGTGETATTSSGDAHLGLGDQVNFTARHFGLRWHMTSRVTEHDSPRRFVDEQVRGPFQAMRHEHSFEQNGSGTRMVDRVDFAAPIGLIGKAAERLWLRRYLRRLIQDRGQHLKAMAEQRS